MGANTVHRRAQQTRVIVEFFEVFEALYFFKSLQWLRRDIDDK
jgi:hypothetical protein